MAHAAPDVQDTPLGRRRLDDEPGELMKDGFALPLEVLLVLISALEVRGEHLGIDCRIRPDEPADAAALLETDQRAEVHILPEHAAGRGAAIRAAADGDCGHAAEALRAC